MLRVSEARDVIPTLRVPSAVAWARSLQSPRARFNSLVAVEPSSSSLSLSTGIPY